MLHKDYLLKHKKVLFATLLVNGKLYQQCSEVENQAQQMFDTLVEQMKKAEGVTEQLKEENQLEWVHRLNSTKSQIKEIIFSEIICR